MQVYMTKVFFLLGVLWLNMLQLFFLWIANLDWFVKDIFAVNMNEVTIWNDAEQRQQTSSSAAVISAKVNGFVMFKSQLSLTTTDLRNSKSF